VRRVLLFSSLLLLLVSQTSVAQTCLGMPSFASGRIGVSPGVSIADGSTGYGAGVTYGAPRNFYGAIGVLATDYDGVGASSTNLNLSAGYQIPLESARAEICPIASLSLGWGPDDVLGPGTDISNRTIAAGASFGIVVGQGSQVQFVPNASLLLASSRLSVSDGNESVSDSEGFAALALGTGFVFASRYSLNPIITIPVGLGDSDPSFGLWAAIHFGR
jgi:hypothetical protein